MMEEKKMSKEKFIAVMKEKYGKDVTEEEVNKYFGDHDDVSLTDEELSNVAGGTEAQMPPNWHLFRH